MKFTPKKSTPKWAKPKRATTKWAVPKWSRHKVVYPWSNCHTTFIMAEKA